MSNSGAGRRVRVERGIYRQANGRYAVCVMVEGRPRFRTIGAVALPEARRERELLQLAAANGELPLSPRMTFEAVAARWLAEFEVKVAAGERRERTLDLYRSQLRVHLLPRLGRRRVALLGPDDVAAVARELQATGLAPWTVKGILGALSCVFTYALRRGYIGAHPFWRLERDERPRLLRSKQRALSRAELARLFAACPRRYRSLLATGLYTGMRLSEVLALSWDDVDFAAGVVHVRYQLARGRGGLPPRRVPPKTAASLRSIPLLPQLAAAPRAHKRASPFNAGADYVFAMSRGTPLLHHNVSKRALRRAAIDGGLDRGEQRLRLHDLRHTLRQPPDHRHPPRRRSGQPHPRPRPDEHDPRHLHPPVRAGRAHRRRARAARPQRVRQPADPTTGAAALGGQAPPSHPRPRAAAAHDGSAGPSTAPRLCAHGVRSRCSGCEQQQPGARALAGDDFRAGLLGPAVSEASDRVDLECGRELRQHPPGRAVLAALDPRDRRLACPHPARKFLLGESKLRAAADHAPGKLLIGRSPLRLLAVGGATSSARLCALGDRRAHRPFVSPRLDQNLTNRFW
jgi:integrase